MMKYFNIKEFTRSSTAETLGIDNTPDCASISRIELLVKEVLDPARALLGKQIIVTSGYRSARLNSAIGGAKNSQHLIGEAADITCFNNKYLFELIQNNLVFDQLIYETKDVYKNGVKTGVKEWIHVSYSFKNNRKMSLIMHNGKIV